jgi:hypothetical protein
MPVSVTMPTIMPAAAQATDTMMAFLAPFSRAPTMLFNSSKPKAKAEGRFVPAAGDVGGATAQRTVLAARLAASVLMTATKPAIMGE